MFKKEDHQVPNFHVIQNSATASLLEANPPYPFGLYNEVYVMLPLRS